MAKHVIEKLIDDLDGGEAAESVDFGFDGTQYQIDLSTENAGKLREALAAYIAAGARVGRSSGTWRPGITPGTRRGSRVDNKAIREWAGKNGHELSERGRIPKDIVEAYTEAQERPTASAPDESTVKPRKRAPAKPVPAADFQPA